MSGGVKQFNTDKDRVEQAVACGRDPYTLGIPRGEVEWILVAQRIAAYSPGDTFPIEVDAVCPQGCPCGEPCYRNNQQEAVAWHRRHRCQPHKWFDAPDFEREARLSPVRPIRQTA